jgi:energy-coupling factor transporter ATP-binding protein EcfA2
MWNRIWHACVGEDTLLSSSKHTTADTVVATEYCTALLAADTSASPPAEFDTQLLHALQFGDPMDARSFFRQHLDHSSTTAGRLTLWAWLERPLTRVDDLHGRRRLHGHITTDDAARLRKLKQDMATMEDGWQSLCWCWTDTDAKKEVMHQVEFAGVAEPLNRVPYAQSAYHHLRVTGMPLLHCLSPLVPILITYLILHFSGSGLTFQEYWNISSGMFQDTFWWSESTRGRSIGGTLMTFVKWMWYLLFVVNAVVLVCHSYRHYKLLALVHRHTCYGAYWMRVAVFCATQVTKTVEETDLCDEVREICHWSSETCHPNVCTLGFFNHAHEYLRIYRLLVTVQSKCAPLVHAVGEVDAHLSIYSLLRTTNGMFQVPEIVTSSPSPVLECDGCIHPALGETQTMHDAQLDTNVVVTGANGSGKSTFVRMLLLNVLLAQSYGICAAKRMRWTPFRTLRGYMLTPDVCGEESLFQAQIRRVESFVEAAHANHAAGEHSLMVVDEIFNSTNPLEAMLLSYAYALRIGECTTARLVLTTHYPLMTRLAQNKRVSFQNWCTQKTDTEYRLHKNKICAHSAGIEMVSQMTKLFTARDTHQLTRNYTTLHKRMQRMPLPAMCVEAADASKLTKVRKKRGKKNISISKTPVNPTL